jgi:hypothetical protein
LYEFRHGDQTYCFRNTVELRHPSRFYGLFGTFDPPVRPGDSGAWVLLPGATGPNWCGLVISGDGVVGHFVLAESVSNWLVSVGYQDLAPA